MKDDDRKLLKIMAENIKRHLSQRKITVLDLEAKTGVHRSVLYRWLRLECMPSITNLATISRFFNTSVDKMITKHGYTDGLNHSFTVVPMSPDLKCNPYLVDLKSEGRFVSAGFNRVVLGEWTKEDY